MIHTHTRARTYIHVRVCACVRVRVCVCVHTFHTFNNVSWLIISAGVILCKGVSSASISFSVHEGGY